MNTPLFIAASALVLATAACAPTPKPQLRTALDCPATQGDLTRTKQATDGKTCTYRTGEGVEINLQLVAVTGEASATLQAIEDSLTATVAPTASADAGVAEDTAATAKDATEGVKNTTAAAKQRVVATQDTASDAAAVAKQAADDANQTVTASLGNGDKDKDDWSTERKDRDSKIDIQIDKHGHKVVADGDRAKIDLPGVHINASDNDASVGIGGIRINANGNDESIHIIRDVRLRGEALSRQKRGIRATFFAVGKAGADGYRFVGYEAAGPKTGPLTVAVVKSKVELDNNDDVARDVRRLVRRNGGV